MCQYDPECTGGDDPQALNLWADKRGRLLTVVCPSKRHPLAAVYAVGEIPAWSVARLFVVAPAAPKILHGFITDADPEIQRHHIHAACTDLLATGWTDQLDYGLCRCGLFGFRLADVAAELAPWPQDEPPTGHQCVASRTRRGAWGTTWPGTE